MVDRKSPE